MIPWNLTDLIPPAPDAPTVFSTFACGGGSTMGYKLAGCHVIGANDIDPEMAWHYQTNLKPKSYYLCPIRDLVTADLPDELFHLDILDGSPPCSTFSLAGNRETDWGKEKHFREGQAKQVLSDLFFDYLDLADRLRPRVVIAENVKGLILGNAKGYLRMIFSRLREIGYRPQAFLVNGADCGVPQRRERVFITALRADIDRPKLVLDPHEPWISAGEATSDLVLTDEEIRETAPTPTHEKYWPHTAKGDSYSSVIEANEGRKSLFNWYRIDDRLPSNTLASRSGVFSHWDECRTLSFREWKRLGSFPDDYVAKTPTLGKYLIGMSVPPRMMEVVARAVCTQWLGVR